MSGVNDAEGAGASSAAKAIVPAPEKSKAPKPLRRGRDELAFLPAALEIMETPASPAGRAIAMTIVGAALFAIIWASLGKVDIVVTSQGRIEPIGNSKLVQPLQQGVVQSILVQDDQDVTAGQPLILLDPTNAAADKSHLEYDLLQASLDRSRLEGLRMAMLTGQEPHLASPPPGAPSVLLEATEAAMQAQYSEQVAKLANLDQQILEQQEKNGEDVATMSQLQATLEYSKQMAAVRDNAMSLGVGDKIDWINANQQLTQQQHQIPVVKMQEVEALSAQQALVAQRAQTVADYETSVLGDLVKANQQINQNQQDLAKTEDELRLDTLRSPIAGTVQQLAVHTVGGVVTPAETLLVVVPRDPKLVARVRIANPDSGFVRVGQQVQVKIAAYDFTRYGTIPGTVIGVSQDVEGAMPIETSPPADGASAPANASSTGYSSQAQQDTMAGSYIAEVALNRTTMATEYGIVQLHPGMELTADIKTGRRSVISYLLSPIDTLRLNAMRQ